MKYLVALIALLSFATPALAAVTFDTSGNNILGSVTTNNLNLTVTSAANSFLICGVINDARSGHRITGVTWNSVAMTFIGHASDTIDDAQLYKLISPASGAHTATASQNLSGDLAISCTSWSNVDQTTGIDAFAASSDSGATATAPSSTVATVAGEAIFDVLGDGNNITSANSPQTQIVINNATLATDSFASSYDNSGTITSPNTNTGWTTVAGRYQYMTASIKQFVAGGAPAPKRRINHGVIRASR